MVVDLLRIKNRVHSAAAMYWSEAEASELVVKRTQSSDYLSQVGKFTELILKKQEKIKLKIHFFAKEC
jgi:hypothetical protein